MRIFRDILVVFWVFFGQSASAAPLGISVISNLSFGSAPQGSPALTIPPGTAETAQNASFKVTGTKNAAYTITLPASATMTTGAGGANRTITINSFQSFPAAGANGMIQNNGQQMIYVGATRAALAFSQVPGAYSGTFTVTVVY
ncbi:MAG: hypothetical protein A2378_03080 [Candidatus Pacebacteria bacterium RIFOXYB1_FULL_44_10]|nr:MAG: hypothetical protein A2378_03080 [Candidatus Pacebacteria bacterium RIFOXYB1_FULL_44_10]